MVADVLFLDIGTTRLIWGYIGKDGQKVISVAPLDRVGGQLNGVVVDPAISSLAKMRRDFGCGSVRDVFIVLGVGDVVNVKRVTKGKLFMGRKRILNDLVENLKFSIWKDIRKKGEIPLAVRLNSVKFDGVERDFVGEELIAAESVTVCGYVFFLARDIFLKIKELASIMGLKLKGIGVRELFLVDDFLDNTSERSDVLLIDIGFSRTVMMWVISKRLSNLQVLNVGSSDITMAIVEHLGVPFWLADKIRLAFFDPFIRKEKWIRIVERTKVYKFPTQKLAEVIEAAIGTMVNRIRREVLMTKSSLDNMSVLVTGGMSVTDGLLEFLGQRIDLPVKLAFSSQQTNICSSQPVVAPYRFIATKIMDRMFDNNGLMGISFSWKRKFEIWFSELWELF